MEASGFDQPRQLVLDLLVPPPPPSSRKPKAVFHNLYFAVLPKPEAADRMRAIGADLKERHGLTGKLKRARLLHVSLAQVGEYRELPDAVVDAALRVGAMIDSKPFEVTFDRVASFNGGDRRAQVLRCGQGSANLVKLGHRLQQAMGSLAPKDFAPHVTVRYDPERIPEGTLDAPVSWTVREFVLVHSLVGCGRHIHLGRWPLRD